MNIFSAFNIPMTVAGVPPKTFGPKPTAENESDGTGQARGASVGAFITVQTLVSFTGATGAISLLWSAIKALGVVPAAWSVYVGLFLSLLIGTFIYYINISDPNTQHTGRDKAIGSVIAFLNSLVLFNATKSIVGS